MAFEAEAGGREGLEVAGATADLEDALTLAAAEVMVVGEAGAFVVGGLPGELDGDEPALIDECADGAVHRRLAEAGDALARDLEDVGRAEGTAGVVEHVADGLALAGVAGHGIGEGYEVGGEE